MVFDIDHSVDPEFLNYLLRWPGQIATYESVAETGNQFGKRRRVYWSVFEQLSLRMPDLPAQRKIAAILSSGDEAIEATQAVIDQLQVVKKAMMAELLTRGIPGRHTRFTGTQLGDVPASWSVRRVEEVGAVDAGKARDPRAEGMLRPYLRVANVFDGEIRTEDVLEMPFTDAEFRRFEVLPGDVLLNEGQSLDLVGRCSIYHGELGRPCAIQNALLRFRAGPLVVPEYAEQYFRFCQSSGRFAEIATQTTSIAHLGLKRFAKMAMHVPPVKEQQAIADVLASVDARIRAEREAMAQALLAKAALSNRLLTGELRVTPDEAAE